MFGKEDFTGDNVIKLSVICMTKMGKKPLMEFKYLGEREKMKFNKIMNEYISTLGENWFETLSNDFNDICNDEIFGDNFKPETQFVKELNTDITLLQKEEESCTA
jgi:hypothetical protein